MPTTPQEDRRSGDRRGDQRSEALPDHVVEDILASDRRRRMLSILAERDSQIVLDDLVRAALARERDTVPSEVPRQDCTEARTEAYEEHLPKLTAVDVVHYDSLVGTLELTDDRIAERLTRSE